MDKRNIVVIGASAGGFEAIHALTAALPRGLDAAVLIVWHISPDVHGVMPQVLNRLQVLPAAHGVDNEPLQTGRIYVAPPDHHMLVEEGRIRITRGPKENRFRPAVDPLFRSAARAYGTRVIGIILSGALDDGTAGLWAIKQYGGIAMAQDPAEAIVSSMPRSAIDTVRVDHVLPIAAMAATLTKLVAEPASRPKPHLPPDANRVQQEIKIAMTNPDSSLDVFENGILSPYTCPECHGVLAALVEGDRVRFRCHTGHAFSADSLLASISENIEDNLWGAVRSIQESVVLLNHMGDHFAEANEPKVAALYFKKAQEASARAEALRRIVEGHEHLSGDAIRHEALRNDETTFPDGA